MKNIVKVIFIILPIGFIFLSSAPSNKNTLISDKQKIDSVEYEAGKKLYKSNCSLCHFISKKESMGPTLNCIEKRRKQDWLIQFVQNADKFRSIDKDARDIFDKYHIGHPVFDSSLKAIQIVTILNYIKWESKNVNRSQKK